MQLDRQLNNKRILIIKPSSLGDIVHTLPVAHALKRCFPDCSIGWIVQDAFAPLLEADNSIDTVYPIRIPSTSDPQAGRWAWLQAFQATVGTLKTLRDQFKQEPYDLILDLHASFRSGLIGRTNPGGVRIGFSDAKELNTLFQHQLIEIPDEVEHAQEKNLLFCEHLGIKAADEDFYLCGTEEDRQEVRAFLQDHNIADTKQLIYANPAARWQSKFWPIEYWAGLADRLHEQGRAMIFGGGSHDVEYIASIGRLMETEPIISAGYLSLPQSAAMIRHSSLYIGLDSGPMHMAALARIPVVALFGPTHPDRVGPYSVGGEDCAEHRIVRADNLACLECRKRTCDHLSCMKGISIQMVYDAATLLLQITDESQP